MSRSNNTELVNPAKKFYEWVGSKGCLKYFDKSLGEKGENVFVQLPFTFLVLDRLSTIRGFSDADQSGFWSNEVRDLKKEIFNVRTKKGLVASDYYAKLAPILNQGANYCQSVYIAFKDEGVFQICNWQIHGSAIGEWINLCKGKDIYKYAITIMSAAPMTKGVTKYFIPVFKLNPKIAESTEAKAVELDKELQEYLKAYFDRNKTAAQENVKAEEIITDRERQGINNLKEPDLDESNTLIPGERPADDINEPIDDLPF